jgi:transcriptional regulator with XRE-family HTH domain
MNNAIAINPGTTLRIMGKSIGPKRNEAARAFVRQLVAERFGGHQTQAAKAFGVEQGSLSTFLAGKIGAGMQLLHGVARVAGVSVDVVIGEATMPPPPPPRTALDVAIEFMGPQITPEIVARTQERLAGVDTSRWLPMGWGLELTRTQRAMQVELGLEVPPESGTTPPAPRKPPEPTTASLPMGAPRDRKRSA